jgi:precorrin-2 dehydrogenase/sirohydrochlorin ferrochelatase
MPVEALIYPVGLVVRHKRCLVVGGGAVAARKAAGLVAAGAEVHLVAKRVGPEVRGLQGLASLEERPYRPGEVAGYWLVMVATGDRSVNQAVFDDAQGAGVWVNSADDPERCTFILPAVARQGPVSVAVSTSGYSPALASWLRSHAAENMGPELAELAELLAGARDRLQASGRSTEDVDWRPVLNWDMLELIRQGKRAEAEQRVEACLSQ